MLHITNEDHIHGIRSDDVFTGLIWTRNEKQKNESDYLFGDIGDIRDIERTKNPRPGNPDCMELPRATTNLNI